MLPNTKQRFIAGKDAKKASKDPFRPYTETFTLGLDLLDAKKDPAASKRSKKYISLRKLAQLAHHDSPTVREFIQTWYALPKVQDRFWANLDEALSILSHDNEETLVWAVSYLQKGTVNWTPKQLMSMADNKFALVQDFGKSLIQARLQQDGAIYLQDLCEHPEPRVEAFVAEHYLEYLSQPSAAEFDRFVPFFRRVLTRVHQHRQTKTKVWEILECQGSKNAYLAPAIAEICKWLSAGGIRSDRERAVVLLDSISIHHPSVDVPYTIIEAPIQETP